ncbi:MAG: hypothetical protein H6R00_4362 [Proteobacteria bacterium]|nr:hypothetical protein [Pseudomonadota bacterium]
MNDLSVSGQASASAGSPTTISEKAAVVSIICGTPLAIENDWPEVAEVMRIGCAASAGRAATSTIARSATKRKNARIGRVIAELRQ